MSLPHHRTLAEIEALTVLALNAALENVAGITTREQAAIDGMRELPGLKSVRLSPRQRRSALKSDKADAA